MRPIHAVPAVLLAAAALAGCGGGSGSSTTAGSPPPAGAKGATTESTPTRAQTQTQAGTQTTQTQAGAKTQTQAKKSKPGLSSATVLAMGARVFAGAGCGGCHTLKAANASGNAGPNLDDLRPSVDAVKRQVANGGGGMPSFGSQLTPLELAAVARFVSERAGQ